MPDSPAIEQYRDQLTLHLVRHGASSDFAQELVRTTGFEMASGHALAQYGGRFYTMSQLAELGAAMGFGPAAADPGRDAAAAAGKAAADAAIKQRTSSLAFQ